MSSLSPLTWTNAAKAAGMVVVNSGMALAIAFGVPLTDPQQAAIIGFVNALMGLGVLLTKEQSPQWAANPPTVTAPPVNTEQPPIVIAN